jgi:hypothetical protein
MLALTLGSMPFGVAWAAKGEGLTPDTAQLPWARWEARVLLGATAPVWRADLGGADSTGLKVRSVSLMGDYYFARSMRADGSAVGFRTTSGVIVGSSSTPWPMAANGTQPNARFSADRRLFGVSSPALGSDTADSSTLPYVGIGYSGLSAKGGWSVTADLGLVALAPGQAVRLGRVFSGTQTLDDTLREMRLSPVLQLGVSYSF